MGNKLENYPISDAGLNHINLKIYYLECVSLNQYNN